MSKTTLELSYNERYGTVSICLLYPWHCYNREDLCSKVAFGDQKYQQICVITVIVNTKFDCNIDILEE